jgi:putative lipoic acid-binding regulatory protein
MQPSREEFKERLDQEHQWPTNYLFKFIVPAALQEQVSSLFPAEAVSIKSSSKGNYQSISVNLIMASSEEVLEIYEKVHQIEGVIAL